MQFGDEEKIDKIYKQAMGDPSSTKYQRYLHADKDVIEMGDRSFEGLARKHLQRSKRKDAYNYFTT